MRDWHWNPFRTPEGEPVKIDGITAMPFSDESREQRYDRVVSEMVATRGQAAITKKHDDCIRNGGEGYCPHCDGFILLAVLGQRVLVYCRCIHATCKITPRRPVLEAKRRAASIYYQKRRDGYGEEHHPLEGRPAVH